METITPVIQPLKDVIEDVIKEEEKRHILQTDLRPVRILLLLSTTNFEHHQNAARETLKIWLQLLYNSVKEAKSILHRSPQRERYLQCFMCNPMRLSRQIDEWKVLFDHLFQGLLTDFLKFVFDHHIVIAPFIQPMGDFIKLTENVIHEEENREILQTDLRPLHNLLLDIATLFQDQRKEDQEVLKIWMQLLHQFLTDANAILQRPEPGQRQRQRRLDCLMCNPGRLSKEIKEWKVLFDCLFQGLQGEFSMFVGAHLIVHRDPISEDESESEEAEESLSKDQSEAEESLSKDQSEAEEAEELLPKDQSEAEESLSKDEAWMLFKRIAFKNDSVPEDIEEYATSIAEECKGLPLAIRLVAAAMVGKSRVDEWKTSLSSIKNADPSSTDTLPPPGFNPQLYRCFRWSYDGLPNSNLKNCFLYSAMYPQGYEYIRVEELVQKWIAEGLVRSKQGSHLMDMAVGRHYVNLLVDRCFFQNATYEEEFDSASDLLEEQSIRVEPAIRDVAIYIGEKEENSVFKAGQQLSSFPEIDNQNCKRISLLNNKIRNLPSEFTCPKLVSLFLTGNEIEEVPSGFLVSLTSLKVLDLSDNWGIKSLPSSVGQLKQLEFLNLSRLDIEELPEEICHLSSLQFLDLSKCRALRALPSKIGELKTLKYLNLKWCERLRVIPHEISHLTSLTTLDARWVDICAETEGSEASIWSLKGLVNLAMLRITVTSSAIEVGIMGTWLEMRHLWLWLDEREDYVMDNVLPEDMQKMSKLQSLEMHFYNGLSLPDYICKFKHLEYLELYRCPHLRELSNNGVWNESVLPKLRVLKIWRCPSFKRLPKGMEKLVSLRALTWNDSTRKTDDELKSYLQNVAQREADEEEEDNEEVEEEASS